MKKLLFTLVSLLLQVAAFAQNRFPKPDFESGYQYPNIQYARPNESIWLIVDLVLLVALMSLVSWAIIKKQTRKPIIWVSVISVAYFGFFRSGCVCSIGSIQNVTLSIADSSYILPVSVLLFFILPIVFAFLFGRVFCAGVCPFGALQELVNIKSYQLSKALTNALSVLPWIYLIFAVLYAATRSTFIICRFDPFIGIFRQGGDFGLIVFGILLLIASIFTGRPFCRFLCPYGAVLGLFSRVSIWKVQITKQPCINCELCHNACPVDAIKPPHENKVKENRMAGVKRILNYAVILPILILAGALLLRSTSDKLSRAHKDVRLYDLVKQQEEAPQAILSLELEAFYGQGKTVVELEEKVQRIQSDYKRYSTIAGAFIGFIIGITLIGLSTKRTRKEYEIEHADCVACGKCFGYCPQNKLELKTGMSSL